MDYCPTVAVILLCQTAPASSLSLSQRLILIFPPLTSFSLGVDTLFSIQHELVCIYLYIYLLSHPHSPLSLILAEGLNPSVEMNFH